MDVIRDFFVNYRKTMLTCKINAIVSNENKNQ